MSDRLIVKGAREHNLRDVDLDLPRDQLIVFTGISGSGKSSLLWALQGTGARFAGEVDVRRGDAVADPAQQPAAQRRELVGLLPQNAADLLYLETVAEELAAGDGGDGSCREILDSLAPGVPDDAHPRDLSEGQRLALALSLVLAARPGVVLLDEPTRGLDYAAKRVLAGTVRDLAAEGHAVLVASHDVEFVAQAADDVRRSVGLVDDDPHLFSTTVAENVRLARPTASDADVAEALRQARLGEWLDSLPDGLGTWVGEGHAGVSGGERARLAIARSLLADQQVLVLDEPTAHLDEATAADLAEEVLGDGGRSVLWISHGTVGLDLVDQVVEMSAEPPSSEGAAACPRAPIA